MFFKKEKDKNYSKDFKTEFAGRELIVEVGKYAPQTSGSCLVRYGGTSVLVTAVQGEEREGIDYFPLLVEYSEKLYAAGKIKGSRWIKREGRPTDEAVLTGRVIDRSIRPLFNDACRKDVQIVASVLEYDGENDPAFCSLLGASIALMTSSIEWAGPAIGFLVGKIGDELVLNPTNIARVKSDFEIFTVGTPAGIDMLEARCNESSEDDIMDAIEFADKHIKKMIKFVEDIQKEIGLPKISAEEQLTDEKKQQRELVDQKIEEFFKDKDVKNIFTADKVETEANIKALNKELNEVLKEDNEISKELRSFGMRRLDEKLTEKAREMILKNNQRPDGRKTDELRDISCEVGLFNRTHGTGLFKRGLTHVLSIVTLGSPGAEQLLDGMEIEGTKRYMHHYNFPGFSVGDVQPNRGASRRDIGHGTLAENALIPVLPSKEEFPYTIRVVSEVLSSNGSSSQASACGSTLALMNAGVPIKRPVAGIAMGLITGKTLDDYVVLTDIQGVEDHSGDMDFKVAGTEKGITAIQLDIKLRGISLKICKETLTKAKEARLKILETMNKTISEPNKELSEFAPRIMTMKIDPEDIRIIIGPGGKMINQMIADYDVEIDLEDDGTVFITSTNKEGAEKAKQHIEALTKKVLPGEIYEGKVTKIVTSQTGGEVGAIVEFLPGKDGMVHISEFKYERIDKVSDIVKVGDTLKVKVMEVDEEKGRIGLSVKALLEKPEGWQDRPPRTPRPGGNSFNRGPRRDSRPKRY
jgi:polyribonucleotide nucleotidyltransferase